MLRPSRIVLPRFQSMAVKSVAGLETELTKIEAGLGMGIWMVSLADYFWYIFCLFLDCLVFVCYLSYIRFSVLSRSYVCLLPCLPSICYPFSIHSVSPSHSHSTALLSLPTQPIVCCTTPITHALQQQSLQLPLHLNISQYACNAIFLLAKAASRSYWTMMARGTSEE